MINWFVSLVDYCIPGVLCQQQFSLEPSSILVAPGSNTTLTCLVMKMGGQAECRWQKDGKPVGLFPGKYSLPPSTQLGNCSLLISQVELLLDDGEWQCQVTSSNISYQDALASSLAVLTVQGRSSCCHNQVIFTLDILSTSFLHLHSVSKF